MSVEVTALKEYMSIYRYISGPVECRHYTHICLEYDRENTVVNVQCRTYTDVVNKMTNQTNYLRARST